MQNSRGRIHFIFSPKIPSTMLPITSLICEILQFSLLSRTLEPSTHLVEFKAGLIPSSSRRKCFHNSADKLRRSSKLRDATSRMLKFLSHNLNSLRFQESVPIMQVCCSSSSVFTTRSAEINLSKMLIVYVRDFARE